MATRGAARKECLLASVVANIPAAARPANVVGAFLGGSAVGDAFRAPVAAHGLVSSPREGRWRFRSGGDGDRGIVGSLMTRPPMPKVSISSVRGGHCTGKSAVVVVRRKTSGNSGSSNISAGGNTVLVG